jgi:hypothetical protein
MTSSAAGANATLAATTESRRCGFAMGRDLRHADETVAWDDERTYPTTLGETLGSRCDSASLIAARLVTAARWSNCGSAPSEGQATWRAG